MRHLHLCDDPTPIEPRPQPLRCYYCDASLEPHVKDGLRIVAAIPSTDRTEHEALMQGLICTACIATFECAHCGQIYCGQIGGDEVEPPLNEDHETGYRDDERRCTLCAPGSWLREPARVEHVALKEAA